MITESQSRSNRSSALADHAKAFGVVLADEFGSAFAFYHALSGETVLLPEATSSCPPLLSPEAAQDLAVDGRARAVPYKNGAFRLTFLLYQNSRPSLLAVGLVEGLAAQAVEEKEAERLRRWGQAVADRLRLTDQLFERQQRADDSGSGSSLNGSTPATVAWEALLSLDHLIRRIRIHKDPERNRQRIVEAGFGLVPARTLAWVPNHPDASVVLLGEPCLAPDDARHLATCLHKDHKQRGPEPIFCATIAEMAWGPRFPGVTSLMAFPVGEGGAVGWVIALNKKAAAPVGSSGVLPHGGAFRRSDAALLTPFVALLDLHTRASHRYHDLKDLLVGLTRSLTAALDAKDSYTYGHSERVARIAVELGRELGLGADDLSDIYLAGLLHDVGKIGIKDAILLKPGPLSTEEFAHIKQHVTIGYTILADLHPIRNLLPGVLWHHERWDGKGYPDGLMGESIPLLARIIAVADGYDAMSTARPYREALPFRRVEEILAKGAGSQWDARVIEAFDRCRQKIHAIRQRGVGESLLAAIDGALRSTDASRVWAEPPTQAPQLR